MGKELNFSKCENIEQVAGLLSTHAGFSDKHPEYALKVVQGILSALETKPIDDATCKTCGGDGYTIEPVCCGRGQHECCGCPEPEQRQCLDCCGQGTIPTDAPDKDEATRALNLLAGIAKQSHSKDDPRCIKTVEGCVETIRAALKQTPAVPDGWQSIECAPKLGQLLLAAKNRLGFYEVANGHWYKLANKWVYDCHFGPSVQPDYWMPLPAAPKPAKE